jgi:hypothetical protein
MATDEKAPEFYTSWDKEAETCMDYLHAIIADEEKRQRAITNTPGRCLCCETSLWALR